MPRSGYASHLPVLEIVRACLASVDNIEFGCGTFSTSWLLMHGNLTTIELNKEWLDKVTSTMLPVLRERWINYLVADELEAMRTGHMHECGVVFVDGGAADKRYQIAQTCMETNICKAIVMHDTERASMLYQKMILPAGWWYVRVEADMPWTSVCTQNKNLVTLLDSIWKVTICDTTERLKYISYPAIAGYKKGKD